MIDFKQARKKILHQTPRLPVTKIGIAEALGYVLAENLLASAPVPGFDSSAVDGYAVRSQKTTGITGRKPAALLVQETVKAGDANITRLKPGCTVRIFTGGQIPPNADAVVKQEDVKVLEGRILLPKPISAGENIRWKGGEFRKNEVICTHGTFITPPVVGILSGLGYKKIKVHRKPRIAVVVTGNEVRAPGRPLRTGQVYDSNSPAIASALHMLGIDPVFCARVPDKETAIRQALVKALASADAVITVGGISVGEYDLVKKALAGLKVKTIFWTVAMKPGKPNYFGTRGRKLVFGVPGNPVAALVSFHLLVRPALMKMMGFGEKSLTTVKAKLQSSLTKAAGRLEFVRGVLSMDETGELAVMPLRRRDSHMLGGLVGANSLIHFPKNDRYLPEGINVDVSFLNWTSG